MKFPECGSVTDCPKCAALEAVIRTSYHQEPRPLLGQEPDPCAESVMQTPSEELEDFGEHLCRRCRRCGYGWVEQVSQSGPPYQDPEG